MSSTDKNKERGSCPGCAWEIYKPETILHILDKMVGNKKILKFTMKKIGDEYYEIFVYEDNGASKAIYFNVSNLFNLH